MVQAHEPVLTVHQHADGVEAQLLVPRAVGRLGEPQRRDPAHLRPLGLVQALEPLAGADPARLDLAEHERAAVGEHEVQLAPARVVVLGEHAVAEPLEVLRGEALAETAEVLAVIGLHACGR